MDWIKMRTDLYTDPKVIMIADGLLDPGVGSGDVTVAPRERHLSVTRNATVGALVSIWGTARKRGTRVGSDLVIPKMTLRLVDDIVGMPGFGRLLEDVGWVKQTEDGVVFPEFFSTYNVDPQDRKSQKHRERQKQYRERKKALGGDDEWRNGGATRDVTVTHREEKSREEYLKETKAKKSPTRFKPPTPQEASDYARTIDFDLDGHNFCDFYGAKGWKVGSSPMKDWKAAVRTWKHRHKGEQQEPASYTDDYPGGKNDPVFQKLKAAGIDYHHWLMKPWPIPSDIEAKLREHREAGEPRPDMWIRMYSVLGWCREDVWEAP
jgi:hypothetical protein